ncbi:MAG: putative toxin-antitoxin system toxin component, PIN family [Thermacetogeniaceae bacterium]
MRAVIDTSVLVSGFLSRKSHPAEPLNAWIFGRFTPVVSPELVEEYAAILTRGKFAALGAVADRLGLLEKILALPWVSMVYPKEKVFVVSNDPKDNKFLECAAEGKAKWIVSGDHHLLELRSWRNIAIVTAAEFVQALKKTEG